MFVFSLHNFSYVFWVRRPSCFCASTIFPCFVLCTRGDIVVVHVAAILRSAIAHVQGTCRQRKYPSTHAQCNRWRKSNSVRTLFSLAAVATTRIAYPSSSGGDNTYLSTRP
uniref:Uncharacterized protein n=1 Tax=Octopus bimaculoides TaxID=37653 RepID=A0A0L8HH41_OCTBM